MFDPATGGRRSVDPVSQEASSEYVQGSQPVPRIAERAEEAAVAKLELVEPTHELELLNLHEGVCRLGESSSLFGFHWNAYWLRKEAQALSADSLREALAIKDRFSGDTFLHTLARKGTNVRALQWALQYGADPNAVNKDGDTPASLALKAGSLTSQSKFIRKLVLYGADISQENSQGESLFTLALANEGFAQAKALANLSNADLTISEKALPSLAQALGARLLQSSKRGLKGDDQDAIREVNSLLEFSEVLGSSLLDSIVNYAEPNGLTPLHVALSKENSHSERRFLLVHGANPNAQLKRDLSTNGMRLERGFSPLHIAAMYGDQAELLDLLEFGADKDLQDADGDTPISKAVAAREQENTTTLVQADADAAIKNLNGEDALYFALKRGGVYLDVLNIADRLEQEYGIAPEEAASLVDSLKLEGLRGASNGIAAEFYLQSGRLDHAAFAKHAYEMSSLSQSAFGDKIDRDAFAHLLPHLMLYYKQGAFDSVLSRLDQGREDTRREGHPFQAELMALLGDPRDPGWNSSTFEKTVMALRSIGAIPPGQRGLSWQGLNNLARIGQLCFSFTKWRFEAMRMKGVEGGKSEQLSLLEKYGFERAPERDTDRAHDSSAGFGPGFVLEPGNKKFNYWVSEGDKRVAKQFHSESYVEFRRAYLLISNPLFGTLIIRNSSPVFGRDSLKHPAYYSDKAVGRGRAFSMQDLQALRVSDIENDYVFTPVLQSHRMRRESDRSIRKLLDELSGLKDDFAAWKFDTRAETAWWKPDENSKPMLAGGHFSRGFSDMVSLLTELYEKNKELGLGVVPDLAFVHPDYPAWSPYEFATSDGEAISRIKINEQVLDVLQKMAKSERLDNAELEATGLRAFFQKAGFAKQAELVLLAPEKKA